MATIPAGEFKQKCLRLLDQVGTTGEPIVITKRGKPVAQLTPLGAEHRGDWRGALTDSGEILGDLLTPALGPDDWDALRD